MAAAVVIGVDPAKRSFAVEVLDGDGRSLGSARFGIDNDGYRQARALARGWPRRVWAVEGAGGVGCHLAQRLVADGERVLDVPAKLSAQARLLATGHGRKNDPADARAVALVALRTSTLSVVTADDQTVALRLLSQRRRELVAARTRAVNRLHRLLGELVAGGAARSLSAAKARALLTTVRPRDPAGRARRLVAADLIDEVSGCDRRLRAIEKTIRDAVAATGTSLTGLVGVGPVTAAVILGEVGHVDRFPTKHHFASYNGSAPLEASSGDVVRHRLSRAGNRRLNHALHIAALANKRHDPRGRDYYAAKIAAGKGGKGALRCLKRRLSDAVFRCLTDDLAAKTQAGPGGHSGATRSSSAAGPTPTASSSDKSLPGPATSNATPVLPPAP